MSEIEDKLELLQEQIESTIEPMTRANLFLKKIDLLKQQKANNKKANKNPNKLDYKKIIDQLEEDIKKRLV